VFVKANGETRVGEWVDGKRVRWLEADKN